MILGDVHGMNQSLHELLDQMSYDPRHDTVLFAGDLLAKSTHSTSISVIDFLTKQHKVDNRETLFPVRGNHDHMIVQWRAWREWFEALTIPHASDAPRLFPATASLIRSLVAWSTYGNILEGDVVPPTSQGREFLQLLEAEWAIARVEEDVDPEEYVEVARKRARGTWREKWWDRIPLPGKGEKNQQWRLFGDHYWLARDMTSQQATYLTSLPLVLHVPSLHLFVTHAGMLPSDPRLSPTDRRQPLAHKPALSTDIPNAAEGHFHIPVASSDIPALRFRQESALLTDVPQNTEPFTVLNIRSVTKKHKVTRKGDKGTPWSKLWNAQMRACRGFDGELSRNEDARKGKGKDKEENIDLPCYPATVVYGHAATWGLDIKRWSVGIDTGCLYGGKLTALVLRNGTASGLGIGEFDGDEDEAGDEDDEGNEDEDESGSRPRRKKLRFGDPGAGIDAKLISIQCPDLDD
ncbi:hypothetical protein PHLGIDRAFT_32591 [Phlebiopsis gigantea 11061_1 CR5-6]|uniref:Calcineurin-like phosphoesterase domain-containing protein n=1 Tax=Phlebiopsis gigantea (strain 11061_1 CR5-6) TaxID=745531 RepID=A0A0C3S174_PHLG1|nr:hypothetical protein PHLGIDRAFT_32591 [Phlebiopsis gigantea 11061_1 CR5-6]